MIVANSPSATKIALSLVTARVKTGANKRALSAAASGVDYRAAIRPNLDLLAGLKAPLESIKALSGTPPLTLGIIQRTVDQILKGIADIVFLLDATGSMGPCINAVKSNIKTFVQTLTTPTPNGGAVVKDWRAKHPKYVA